MRIVLFEDSLRDKFLPLTYTRPVGDLLIGIEKISDKWKRVFSAEVFHETRAFLSEKHPVSGKPADLKINARVLPDESLINAIENLQEDEMLLSGETVLAIRSSLKTDYDLENLSSKQYSEQPLIIQQLTDLFAINAAAIDEDFKRITAGRKSGVLHASNTIIGDASKLFIEEGATIYASVLNTTEGPIYVAKDAEIMEGSLIRGPFALGEHSAMKMASKVYGATTIGPYCKVGGEISNSVIQGYSNKAHDGFIGNTILGQWCNLGADTNTSNLKNNYSSVRIFDYAAGENIDTGLTFCGLIMGDHSKCSINTMFNTGTVVGVAANIFGSGFPPKHVPSFSWGGSQGLLEYELSKMLATAEKVYARRGLDLNKTERDILSYIFKETAVHRLGTTQSQE